VQKLIQVTSPAAGDGKSTLAINLAVSMAQSGKKTILVESDFRRPRVHRLTSVSNGVGVNDGRVQMKTNSQLNIKSVQILDILGRTLYQLKGSSATEIFSLSNLSQSTYIAKVELSNGQVITKRAIKRY
jgi:Mrp family chromosome partitioning ATPase